MRERPISPPWLRGALLVALGVVLCVYAWWPMLANYPHTPEEDGRYVYQQFEIAKAGLRLYGEMPLWNAFDCRGIPMWDHPESMTASPIVLLTAGINTTITIILWNIIHVVVGFVGMWLLVRDELRLSRAAAFVGASMFSLAVCHTAQYGGEHETFVTFLNAPLLLLLWRKAEHDARCAVGMGIVLALMVYDGATYPLPYTGVMLAVETLTRLTSWPRAVRIAKVGALACGTGVLLGASRLLPLFDQLTSHKRAMGADTDRLKPSSLWLMYTHRTPNWRATFNGQQYVFGEYITYIGLIGVVVVLLGFVVSLVEAPWLAVVAVALLLLMAGHFSDWAPWALLHKHVTPFKSMRVPARFRLLEMMCLAAFAALAVDRVPAWIRRFGARASVWRGARVVMLGLALLAVGDAVGLGLNVLGYRFNGRPPTEVAPSPRFYYGGAGLTPDFIDQPRQNRAWLGCRSYEWAFRADAPLWTGDEPQARAQGEGAVVEGASRTHNTFTVDVVATAPSRILLNSAFDPGWQASVGAVVEDGKMLAVDVPPGRHRIRMKYWPRRLTAGIALSVLGLVFVVVFFVRGARPSSLRRRAEA